MEALMLLGIFDFLYIHTGLNAFAEIVWTDAVTHTQRLQNHLQIFRFLAIPQSCTDHIAVTRIDSFCLVTYAE